MKEEKKTKPHKKFFESLRLEVGRILIEELTNWESAKKPTEEEFYRLVDRIVETLPHQSITKLKGEK